MRAAKASGALGRELRRLQWQAMDYSRGVTPIGPGGGCLQRVEGHDRFAYFEEALAAVGRLAGHPPECKLQITEAKSFLRAAYGEAGGSLASRLSKLSTGRNALAHPDVGFVSAIADLAQGRGGAAPLRRSLVSEIDDL